MNIKEIQHSGFTEGYGHGIDGKARIARAPLELVLFAPEQLAFFNAAYEEGYERGQADRLAILKLRADARADGRGTSHMERQDES